MSTTRRLAAILAADVAGYSRLMAADEVHTLDALKACRREVVDPAIAEHNGRIVKTTGDGMLVEFASAVDAVTCAMSVQAKMVERANDPKIAFRIGINVGDIIIDGDDIFGDGVNVAARVENECEPGGVFLSANAFEQIRAKTPFEFHDLGEKSLKNIDRPIRIYAARSQTNASVSANSISSFPDAHKPLPLPDKPSIAVLPFQNMSGDPEQEYFADGMVEDIITALSRKKGLFVIARNSSFTYKGKAVDIKQVGRDLGVRYVLEGSVRKAGGKVRITGQLIEAATNTHLWADKFDGVLDDVFDLQDRVTVSVVTAVAPQLELAEVERAKRKPTQSLSAYDYNLRGHAAFYQMTQTGVYEARELWLSAVNADPNFAPAWANLAIWHNRAVQYRPAAEQDTNARGGMEAARRALLLDKENPDVLARAGAVIGLLGRQIEEGLALVDESTSLDPNLAFGWTWSGLFMSQLGSHDAAIERSLHALRLNPRDPVRFVMMNALGASCLLKGRYEEAASWIGEGLRIAPDRLPAMRIAVASNALAGQTAKAHEWRVKLQSLWPDSSISEFMSESPIRLAMDRHKIAEGLRLAGLPE